MVLASKLLRKTLDMSHYMPKLLRVTLVLIVLLSLCSVANAVTIDFGGLAGANLSPFPSPYLEDGFTVVPLTPLTTKQGTASGSPTPSVVFAGGPGSIEITLTDGGNFTFSSVDGASNNGISSISWTGWLGGIAQYSGGKILSSGLTFVTASNPNSAMLIDRLTIGMASGNLDNIQVSAVPEPSTIILLLLGLAGVGTWGRRGFPKQR